MSVWHSLIFLFFLLHPLQLCFKWLLGFMDTSQEQEQDFGVLLKQGAEGVSQESICSCCLSFACFLNSLFASLQRVFASTFVGRKCVIKEHFSKKYRHPLLDSKLTLKRLNAVSLSNQHVIIRFFFSPYVKKNLLLFVWEMSILGLLLIFVLFMYKQRVQFVPKDNLLIKL